MEGSTPGADERFAEWFVWAKREVGTDDRVCLGAAQAATEALDAGADDLGAAMAARRSVAGHGIALIGRIVPRQRAYAEWYDWARREVGGDRERMHAAVRVAMQRLEAGAGSAEAADAARAAPGQPAAPARPVQPPTAAPVPPPYQASPPTVYAAPAPYAAPVAESVADAYASFWRRLGGYAIDTAVLYAANLAAGFVVGVFVGIGLAVSGQEQTDQVTNEMRVTAYLIAFVIAWLYYAGLESSAWQGTIGKRVMGLVVTDLGGRRIGFGRASGRFFGRLLLIVGGWFILFTPRRQGLHDIMAGTLVVRRGLLALITAPPLDEPPPPRPGGAGEIRTSA